MTTIYKAVRTELKTIENFRRFYELAHIKPNPCFVVSSVKRSLWIIGVNNKVPLSTLMIHSLAQATQAPDTLRMAIL